MTGANGRKPQEGGYPLDHTRYGCDTSGCGIWSLEEVLTLYASAYITLGSILRHLSINLWHMPDAELINDQHREEIKKYLPRVAENCKQLELFVSTLTIGHWKTIFDSPTELTYIESRCALEEIERTINNEVKNIKFIYAPRERHTECDKMLKEIRLLWEKPWSVSLENLDRARFCYLVDEFTASVFHSMRAAEKILVTTAKSLGMEPARDQWQKMIEGIESAVKDLDKLPKGVERENKQTLYSEIAMQLRYIKNAWRNHVMHARSVYNEKDARDIWWHVKRMLESAASDLEEAVET